MNKVARDAFETGDWYMDGPTYVVVIGSEASGSVQIGTGITAEEAAESLESTGIEDIDNALRFAADSDWICEPNCLSRIDNPIPDETDEIIDILTEHYDSVTHSRLYGIRLHVSVANSLTDGQEAYEESCDSALGAINELLPEGWHAVYTGSGHTDDRGDCTEEVLIATTT